MCIRVVAKENKNDHTFIEFGTRQKLIIQLICEKIYEYISL